MRKNLLMGLPIYTLLLLIAFSVQAQPAIIKKPGITLGGNFIYASPKGRFDDYYNYGVGAEAYGGVGWGSTYLVVTIGVTSHINKPGLADRADIVPLKFGLKKYLLLKRLFLNADVGSASVKVSDTKVRAFTGGVGAGVRLLGLEASLYYSTFRNKTGYSTKGYANSLQAHIGWNFTI
jgi:hypothetical protein